MRDHKHQWNCHVCDGPTRDLAQFESMSRVTSDCRPWPSGGRLAVCSMCGCLQKPADATWRVECDQIYRQYAIYHQSAGIEQSVFQGPGARACPRSVLLVEKLMNMIPFPAQGALLDVGCGNGALLRAFSAAMPAWRIEGNEINAKYEAEVLKIPGVHAHHAGDVTDVAGCFEVITLIHVLEHILDPVGFLTVLGTKLSRAGHLIIQVPHYEQNPFDLLIADHSSHFSLTTLANTVKRSGFDLVEATSGLVPKELTVIARKSTGQAGWLPADDAASAMARSTRALAWLSDVAADARRFAANSAMGLFGTSIAATWLTGELNSIVGFFVDEDPARVKKEFMGRPVRTPSELSPGDRVYIGMAPRVARSLAARLGAAKATWGLPPELVLEGEA